VFVESALGRRGVGRTVAFPAVVARAWQIWRATGLGDFSAAGGVDPGLHLASCRSS
jgi:hypothetical protein